MSKSTVYFTNELTPEAVVKMYKQLGVELPGKVAVKVHSGEDGNQNYLHPEFMKPVIDAVHGTVVECNTAYGGARNETPKHMRADEKTRLERPVSTWTSWTPKALTWSGPSRTARCCKDNLRGQEH